MEESSRFEQNKLACVVEFQGCIKLRLAPPRGADFQSAVSQVSNLRTTEKASEMGILPICRLEVGDTAGWKPALRGAQNSELDAALVEFTGQFGCRGRGGQQDKSLWSFAVIVFLAAASRRRFYAPLLDNLAMHSRIGSSQNERNHAESSAADPDPTAAGAEPVTPASDAEGVGLMVYPVPPKGAA